MFDTRETGRKIAALRKEHNMTQYELADRLGISFQAVSNWERGNSMPDIAKLPEIAELFGCTIDELLGKSNPVLNLVAEGETAEAIRRTVGLSEGMQILAEAAPLLKPRQITEMANSADSQSSIAPLLPFLDDDDLVELMEKYEAQGHSVTMFYPFLSDEALLERFNQNRREGKPVTAFLPFLDDKTLFSLATEAFEAGGSAALAPFLPFLNDKDVKAFAQRILKAE